MNWWRAKFWSDLLSDRTGATALEFAFVGPPFLLMLMGGMDLARQVYVKSVLSGALNDAARRASVENPDFIESGATTEARINAAIKGDLQIIAPDVTIVITVKNFEDFTGINKSEKLMVDNDGDGQYDGGDHDCFEDLDSDGQFDIDAGRSGNGSASDVVHYNAKATLSHLFPVQDLFGGSSVYSIESETVMRNQPFSNTAAAPPVICG